MKASDTDDLVRFEANLEEVRSKKRGEIVAKYTELIEWI